ncbi:MAG: TIGR00341 family protein [Pseudomonadota bacterium]|jgi:uncharacterized hydrophobic protein (TIGR00341 family)|nr:TIGR00341 family protein [Pseudomonadota bacterium]QKK05664.1 MAG: TIGR00341 family protein [Pseudomonadota bacterium]
MSLRTITLLTEGGAKAPSKKLTQHQDVIQSWSSQKMKNSPRETRFLMDAEHMQDFVDLIQQQYGRKKDWRIIIAPVETTVPLLEEKPEPEYKNAKKSYGSITREVLYDKIFTGAATDMDFLALVILSTIVTAIGLITDNVAVLIGAMVIAPLLGPNLALSFAVTLGDKDMITRALKANAAGFSLTMLLSILLGFFIPEALFIESSEFIARTDVGYGGIILALSSGAAAVLSLTSGVSTTMVGVMVAVALMPPAVALGLSFGSGLFTAAYGAGLLLAINIICVNLAAKAVFTLKGIRPRTWYQRKKSKQSLRVSLFFWFSLLCVLIVLIYLWHNL